MTDNANNAMQALGFLEDVIESMALKLPEAEAAQLREQWTKLEKSVNAIAQDNMQMRAELGSIFSTLQNRFRADVVFTQQ